MSTYNWKDEDLDLLGTMSDKEVAKRLGICHMAVYEKRVRYGIAPYRKHRTSGTKKTRRWTKEAVAKLGKVTDKALAEELGLTRQAVTWMRQKRKIKPIRRHSTTPNTLTYIGPE